MKLSELLITTHVVSDFQENCYVLHLQGRNEAVVIDPGIDPADVIEDLKRRSLTPVAILITHGHYDHIGGVNDIMKEWPEAELVIGEIEQVKLLDPMENLSACFGMPRTTHAATKTLISGEQFDFAGIRFKAALVPGHSRGHLIYIVEAADGAIAFVGDLIFYRSIGRSDFPDGNHAQLLKSIRDSVMTLPPATRLYCGHGLSTTVGSEQLYNPMIR